MSRHKDLLTYWNTEVRKAIEIGALAAPLFPPTDHRVRYIDHITAEELRKKYAGAGDRLVNNIVDVSYTWESGNLKPRLDDWYPLDLVAASHVIEHVPNFVGWLNALSDVLSPEGHVSLAVPFKEQTFDCRRPVSTLGDVLDAWVTGAVRPAPRHVVDQRRYGVRVDGHNCWVGEPTPDRFSAVLPKVEGLHHFLDQWADGHYIDSHVWVFTPASFQDIVDDLRLLNLIDLEICKGPTLYGHEFVVHLRCAPNAAPRRACPPKPATHTELWSGERQVGAHLADIRADHTARYAFGLQHLSGSLHGLDLFCGTGYGSAMIAEAGHSVLGIDGSKEAIQYAEEHYGSDRTLFTAKSWPFVVPRGAFDFAFALESLEHVSDGAQFLDNLAHALKPSGLLIVSTPNETLFPFQPERHEFHVLHYTLDELTDMVKNAGFEVVTWGGQTIYAFTDGHQIPLDPTEYGLSERQTGQFVTLVARKL